MRTSTWNQIAALLLVGLLTSAGGAAEDARFQAAKPIWPKDREREMNLLVGFRTVIEPAAGEKVVLRVAAATIYRAWINGQFLGCGPARGPHGYFRVDQWDLSRKLQPGKNLVAVEVAGYNANSYYLLDQPSFLQAEVVAGGSVLASTGGDGEPFSARMLDCRVQKVQRYSFQRPFTEVYRLTPDDDRWRRETADSGTPAAVAVLPEKHLLPRRVRYPQFAEQRPLRIIAAGRVEPIEKPKNLWKDRSLTDIGPKLKGFPERELSTIPSIEGQCFRSVRTAALGQPYSGPAPLPWPPPIIAFWI